MGALKLGSVRVVLPWLSALALLTVISSPAMAQFNPCMPDNPLVTPPPRPDNKPVISDGIIYYLDYVPKHCQCPRVERYPSGGVIKDSRAIVRTDNPHIIQGNIEIAPTGCLYIQPGCQLRFHPGFGIIVNGTLISRGSEEPGGRIVMTKAEGQDTGAATGPWAQDARLVEGNTTQDGRLDLLFRGKWRGICNNYNNWTAVDANVTCRHLGFLKGNFTYHSYSRNYTAYMLYTAPRCLGSENSLLQCPGAVGIQYGDHMCDGQQLVGFECEGLRPGLAVDHWRGLEFYNSSVEASYRDNNVFMNRTHSWLEYTDILYAGLDIFHGLGSDVYYPRAAISASPYVPIFNNVTVKYCAHDAFNLTEVRGDIHIANSTIAYNRGHGIFVQTSFGQVLVNMTNVTNNWGDGVKVYLVNVTQHDFPKQFPFESSFCLAPDLANQAYPALLYQDVVSPSGQKPLGSQCGRRFTTRGLKQITVHVMMVERDPLASGTLEFWDGGQGGRLMACMPVNNGSLPQSLTTLTQTLYVRFTFNLPANYICPTYKPCIRFLMELQTGYGPAEDFALIYSKVSDNIGYGVNIQDMRSKVFFNTSIVSFNQYGAGIRVYQGAGEVAINNTHIEGNQHCGVNITYSGGYQMFNNSNVIANRGYGVITEYLLVNRSRFETEQRMEVVRGRFELNELIALRVGNYCRGGSVLVNESTFAYNLDEAIEFVSCNASFFRSGIFCNPSALTLDRNFSVAFNHFHSNYRHAVWVSPMVNTVGILTNNTFSNHSLGAVRIDNGYDLLISRWYRQFRVNYSIFENTFENNHGRYALNVRLTQDAPFQAMEVKFNRFRNNFIQDSFPYLNPRSRASAVAVVSSSNVIFQRNAVENPESVRQVATHLIDPSVTIDTRFNWWGVEVTSSTHFQPIHAGIFDQDDRYNLARMNYMPVLNSPQLYDGYTSSDITYKWPFMRGSYLGGILESDFTVPSGRTYHVDQDIYINPTATLTLGQGSRLLFDSAVGLLAHGRLNADGLSRSGTITFDLFDDPDTLPMENRTASVRLADGLDEFEGRLEVETNEGWGTVCSLGWREENALLACQQLGLTYYPQLGRASSRVTAPSDVSIALSWVRCDDTDLDLSRCRHSGEVDSACTHAMDVFIRCQPPTWAGVTIPAMPRGSQYRETTIRHVTLRRAGMLDHATMALTPALRIDYNFYQISFITVENALSDAIHVKYHHPTASKLLEYANLTSNGGNGLVTRTPGLVVQYSTVTNSGKAGFLYDPFFTEYEALIVRNSIHPDRRQQDLTRTPSLNLRDQMSFLVCSAGSGEEDHTYYTQITATTPIGRVTLQVLDFFPNTTIERVTVFDASRAGITSSTKGWRIPEDLIDFPVVSTGQELTIQLRVKGVRSGRLTFAVIPRDVTEALPRLETRMVNCTFSDNDQGIVTRHYNDPFNEKFDITFRPAREFIYFERVVVLGSRRHAVYMPSVTKYHDDYIPTYEDLTTPQRVASISYDMIQCKFHNNGYGIFAEHNHVDFANNVWHWRISQSEIVSCGEGGFETELPRVNDDGQRLAHSVIVNETVMRDNKKFAFTIAGYYANITIRRNDFRDNICRKGLITVSGMEKDMVVRDNLMQRNTGRYVMDLDITSHAEYSAPVSARLEYNDIRDNTPDVPSSGVSPTTYAVAFRGLQNISATRNLFENPGLGYELVAGVMSLSLGNPVDVRQNWWGTTNELQIRNRTFDFDDWNNYAIALYYPYLTRRDFLSDVSPGSPIDIPLDLTRLGGRVAESLVIPYKPTPYVVYSDLTVMPNAILTLEAGTELLFRPNVGILVLGTLVARGTPQARIKLRPQPRSPQPQALTAQAQQQQQTTLVSGALRLRGDGKLFKNAGFLEFYNASSHSWNLMCDSQFNEKTAEVVCRQLGKETVNVRVRYTHLYDHYIYGEPQYFRKEFWFYSYFCRGDENSMEQCTRRYNYNLLPCIYAANYTFVTCGDRNLEPQYDYWGNIRFSTDTYDEQILAVTTFDKESILEYVDIEGAGMLHGEKVGAIQATYKTPIFRYVNISKSACNGYDVIAPRDTLEITHQNVSGNLGYGINILMLNGESSERASSLLPLGASTIPYYVFGLVEMCRMEKAITLRNRAIVYYKYSARAVDCVKIIHSESSRKRIGLRFLQLRLFQEDFSRNSIEIFDGLVVSDATMVKEILPNASNTELLQLYASTGPTLTLHVHASVSHGSYGFMAEIVTLPPVGLTYPGSDYRHEISDAILLGNEEGALQYKNVGEINPSVFVQDCWIEGNGVAILNLTSPPTLDFSLQGTKAFVFHRNFVARNKGGMYVNAHTMSMPAALRGNITNNVFAFGSHGEALNLTGHYFQRFYVFQNFIYNYTTGDFRDVVHVRDVVVNFTYNSVLRHEAHYILSAYNNDDRGAIQEYVSNGFYDNNSTALLESTIKVGRGYPRFQYNYIVNDMNDFEMETSPKIEARDSGVEAEENWWGSDQRSFITGKIWDSGDNPQLGSVNFWPPRFSNSSVVDSVCPQGWKHDNGQCFRYMGAALPYAEAQQFCLVLGGSLAQVRGRHDLLYYVLRLMASDYSDSLRAWVQGEVGGARCGVIERNYFVEELDCWRTLRPFVCQKDPVLSPPSSSVLAMALGIGIGVGGAILLVVAIIGVMWCVKSRRRKQERFERAASIRSSIRGSMRSKSQLTIQTVGTNSRHHLDLLSERSGSQSTVGKSSLGSTSYLGSQHSLAQAARRADKDPRRYHSNESLDRDPGRAPNYRLQTMPDRRPPVPRMGAAYRGRGGRDPKPVTDDDEYYTDSTFDDLEDEKKVNLSNRRYANMAFEPSPTETPVVNEEEDEEEEDEEEEEEKPGMNASRKSLTSFSGDSTPEDSTPVKQKPFALPPYNLPPPPPSPPLSKDSPPPPYKQFSRDDMVDSERRPQPQPRQDSLPPKPQPRGPKPSTAPRPRQLNMAANPPQRAPHDSSSDLEPWNRPYQEPEPARPVEDSPPRTLYEQYRDKHFRADPPGPTLQPARSNPSLHSGEREPAQRPAQPRLAPSPYRDASPHPSVGSHEGQLGRPAESRPYRPNPQYMPAQGRASTEPLSDVDTPRSYPSIPPPAYQPPAMPSLQPGVEEMRASPFSSQFPSRASPAPASMRSWDSPNTSYSGSSQPPYANSRAPWSQLPQEGQRLPQGQGYGSQRSLPRALDESGPDVQFMQRRPGVVLQDSRPNQPIETDI